MANRRRSQVTPKLTLDSTGRWRKSGRFAPVPKRRGNIEPKLWDTYQRTVRSRTSLRGKVTSDLPGKTVTVHDYRVVKRKIVEATPPRKRRLSSTKERRDQDKLFRQTTLHGRKSVFSKPDMPAKYLRSTLRWMIVLRYEGRDPRVPYAKNFHGSFSAVGAHPFNFCANASNPPLSRGVNDVRKYLATGDYSISYSSVTWKVYNFTTGDVFSARQFNPLEG